MRAKRKIRDAGIPYKVPDTTDLSVRVDAVLTVIYLIFNDSERRFLERRLREIQP
nr:MULTISPECIES: hypothetical protein [Nostoc]